MPRADYIPVIVATLTDLARASNPNHINLNNVKTCVSFISDLISYPSVIVPGTMSRHPVTRTRCTPKFTVYSQRCSNLLD